MAAEEALILATQAGDRAAFEGLYKAYYDRVYRYIFARVNNRAESEDLAAEVFLKAYVGIHTYSPRGLPFASWLFRIAHNLVIDHVRRRARRPTTVLDESVSLMSGNPEDEVVFGMTYAEVRAAMVEITDAQRQVIALRFGAELSIAETAEAMKKKEGAIKALQHSAIGALRQQLAKRGHSFSE